MAKSDPNDIDILISSTKYSCYWTHAQ